MQEDTSHFTIEGLAEQVAIPVRTIRYYISEGLLPGPEGRGKATSYSEEHLQRLRLIRLLSYQHRPLAEIHHLLQRLSLGEIRALLADEEQRARELGATDLGMPQKYVATLLKNASSNGQSLSPTVSPSLAMPIAGKVQERPGRYEVAPMPVGEAWKRWELAPGVELLMKEEVVEQSRELLERIWKAVGLF